MTGLIAMMLTTLMAMALLGTGAARRNPALVESGRKLFAARCASCHGERGDRPLANGAPLSERKLDRNVVAKMLRGRLKDAPATDQEAVTAYILEMTKRP